MLPGCQEIPLVSLCLSGELSSSFYPGRATLVPTRWVLMALGVRGVTHRIRLLTLLTLLTLEKVLTLRFVND